MNSIDPVLVLSTGRCGSTMVSDILNLHPDILSLSEVFSSLGSRALRARRLDGKALWKLCSRQNPGLRAALAADTIPSEVIYPFDKPGARYSRRNIPPILCATLPHLSPDFEELYDDLESAVRARPKASLREQYLFLFEWLRERLGRGLWIERSGGSLLTVPRLRQLFPEARIVHVFRDGRDTALCMSQHASFRIMLATINKLERLGLRPLETETRAGPITLALAFIFLLSASPKKMLLREFDLAAYGDLWSRMVLRGRKLLSDLPEDRFLALRYEDLLKHPREKLKELINFIDSGLADAAWLEKASLIPRPNPPKYLLLDPKEQERLSCACAPGLEALGYNP